MDIHKPKPWHGLREFLKEYLIIVIGVLTALSAEAGVEWLHWRHLAEQHDAELAMSAQSVAANAIQQLAVDGCLRGALQEIGEALLRPGTAWKGLKPDASGPVESYLPPRLQVRGRPWAYAPWESALADGSLTHLPADRVRAYALIYRTSMTAGGQQGLLGDLLPELTPLAFDQTLTAQDKARYLTVVARADRIESRAVSMARTIGTTASEWDWWPPKTMLDPLMAANRDHEGACVQQVDRAAFRKGGSLVVPTLLRKP
ncbi:hypothetical protein [Phenylobacterium sp.]|jgi:hypothetical protein|uniref:hypothetical protein n=1 Tax=Phenylobacterium sp. TaxID=1871053 RepID=UPI002F3F6EB3